MTPKQKQQFRDWLVNNVMIPTNKIERIVDHVENYFASPTVSGEAEGANILRLDKPFPLKDILSRLVKASEYLLNDKNYDGPDYEELGHCVTGAKEVIEWLSESIPPIQEGEAVEFAEWLDKQRDGRLPMYKDMKIWGKEGAYKICYSLFKQRK